MKHIKLTLQYDGSRYHGWQIQAKGATIQGVLEQAVFSVTGEHQRVTGASRTDAGVHALAQTAVFRTGSHLEPDVIRRALNANLPDDIRIIDSQETGEDFHPRHSAKDKTYSYIIHWGHIRRVFLRQYSWQMHRKPDLESMLKSSSILIGKHDFSSFRASGCSSKHPFREIKSLNISEHDSPGFITFKIKAPVIKITINANAFLRHMARNIVGTLVDIGCGKIPVEGMKHILESKDRRNAGQTAPARGLFLEKITY